MSADGDMDLLSAEHRVQVLQKRNWPETTIFHAAEGLTASIKILNLLVYY